jgi:putative mRNA 3-end processing factor
MAIRGIRRRRGVERGFVLSDHADFAGLNTAVRATEAERVLLTHGYTAHFARWLCSLGLAADELKTDYGEEHEGHE